MYVFSVSSVSKSLVIFYRLFCKTCLHLFLKRSFSMFSVVSEAPWRAPPVVRKRVRVPLLGCVARRPRPHLLVQRA